MLVIELIRQLETDGVLGRENVPEPGYWSWPILQPEHLPAVLQKYVYDRYGQEEIRWAGDRAEVKVS